MRGVVEAVLPRQGVVFVRFDEKAQFEVTEQSSLNGVPIHRWLEMPRVLDSQGRQRMDLFAFALREPADASHFAPGQAVTFIS